MARAVVLQCDICGGWDSPDRRVRTVSVTGPKFDLCTDCRAGVLIFVGVDGRLAERYHLMLNEREEGPGTYPALSAAKDWSPDQQPELPFGDPDAVSGTTVPGSVDSAATEAAGLPDEGTESRALALVPAGDTEGKPAPARRSRKK